jgi:hypothetical protein
MLHYAYSRQLPVQIVVTDGKEAVISEKHMSAHFGQTLLVGYSNIIRSAVRPAFKLYADSWLQQPGLQSTATVLLNCQGCDKGL